MIAVARPSPPYVTHRWSLWARLGEGGAASFDAEGRLLTARLGGAFFRRGLDNSVLKLRCTPRALRPYAVDPLREPARVFAHVRKALAPTSGLGGRTRALVERAHAGLGAGYAEDARRFASVVGPVPVLPPNHSRAVVMRLTEGCSWNVCRFCDLYRDVPFRVKTAPEFRAHALRVLEFFGEGAGMRPSIYLGEASALEAGPGPVHEALAVLHDVARIADRVAGEADPAAFKGDDPRRFEGVYAFSQVTHAAALGAADARALAAGGMRRLYLGVETGSDPLLRLLAKPHRAADVGPAVAALHAGGIAAGIILLVGAGGRRFREEHRRESVRQVRALGLGRADWVFLSPLDRAARAGPAAGTDPLDDAELERETQALRAELLAAVRPARVADYDLDSFVY